jgi:hypothetical protein
MKCQVVRIAHPGAMFSFKAFRATKRKETVFFCLYSTANGDRHVFGNEAEVVKRRGEKLGKVEVPDAAVDAAFALLRANQSFKEHCEPFLWEENQQKLLVDK